MRDKRMKEVKMWGMLKEIVTYLIYVALICTLTYDSRDINAFRTKEQLDKVFAEEGKYHDQFSEIASYADVFSWMEKILVPNLFAEHTYNNKPVANDEKFLLKDFAYYRIGTARLRQARVKKEDQCTIISEMKNIVKNCYKRYSIKSHDDGAYGEGWSASLNSTSSQWQYKTNLDLDGVPMWGSVDAYSGGGFVADLGSTSKSALQTIRYLKDLRWLDRQSRALFTEFNVYNPNINMFAAVSLILEFPQSGGVLSTPLIQPLRLYYYVGPAAVFRVVLEIIFAIFTIYFIFREGKKVRTERGAYLKSFWNIIELLTLFGSISAIVLYGCHFVFTKVTLRKFQQDPNEFTNFQYLLIWEAAFTYCCGVLVFLSMVKMLRLLRFNVKVAELSSVLSLSMRPLSGFFLSVIIIYTAFALFAMMVFGQHAEGYSNIVSSFETLFSMMLMHFSFHDLQDTNPVLGPIFFILYVVTLAFFVINMLVAILNESYNKVKVQGIETETDYKMVGYIVEQIKGLLGVDSWTLKGRGHARVGQRAMTFNAQRRKSMKYEDITAADMLG